VDTADAGLTIRPPGWTRAWVVAFPLVVAALGLSGVVPLRGDPGRLPVLAFCAFAAVLGRRLFRLAALGTSDGRLTVRNHWRDRTVVRDVITEVHVGRGISSWNRAVLLRPRDDSTVRLDVTETQFGTRRLEQQAHQVRAWVSGTPQPYR
jgi:hypothetical protein